MGLKYSRILHIPYYYKKRIKNQSFIIPPSFSTFLAYKMVRDQQKLISDHEAFWQSPYKD